MAKIAFFDVDGTMINVPNALMAPTEETKRVLKEFQNQGNFLVVASARARKPECLDDIHFDGEVLSDGQYISFKDQVLMDNIFNSQQIEFLIEIARKHKGECILSGYHGQWVSTHEDEYTAEHHRLFSGSSDLSKIELLTQDNHAQVKPNTITSVFGNAVDLLAAQKELPEEWEVHSYSTPDSSIRMDVHLSGFTKGTACEFLYQHLKIAKADTLGFGDGKNDIEMLRLVGLGIAMGNAEGAVKEIADDVTDTVDNDGISKSFKKYFSI